MKFPTIALAILIWPLIEIAAFVFVGSRIGVLATIGLVLLSGIAGTVLMRVQGLATLERIRIEMAAGRTPGRELAHGVMILLAGLLLLLPGFVSDILGILLFVPPIRDAVWKFLSTRVKVVSTSGGFARGFAGHSARGDGKTIELKREDYQSAPKPSGTEPNSPWRRLD